MNVKNATQPAINEDAVVYFTKLVLFVAHRTVINNHQPIFNTFVYPSIHFHADFMLKICFHFLILFFSNPLLLLKLEKGAEGHVRKTLLRFRDFLKMLWFFKVLVKNLSVEK